MLVLCSSVLSKHNTKSLESNIDLGSQKHALSPNEFCCILLREKISYSIQDTQLLNMALAAEYAIHPATKIVLQKTFIGYIIMSS